MLTNKTFGYLAFTFDNFTLLSFSQVKRLYIGILVTEGVLPTNLKNTLFPQLTSKYTLNLNKIR